jgi:eukaryotic-like serine/threonine-protein kinase
MSLTPGTSLGPYEIVGPLGAGGMGEVYKARDTRLDRTVAIKVLPDGFAGDGQRRQRFEREARAIAALSHPQVCALYDVGRAGETDYLVMEYLEGETLAERLQRGALPLDQVLRHAAEIAGALSAAHRVGIVHRDLKPGNVMLTKSGVKLLDFGLAKAASGVPVASLLSELSTESKPLTGEGTILGTLQYMAPEQLEGKEADARTDIFSLGAVLYEMATGRRAFEGKTRASVIAAILERDPPLVTATQPLAPPALDRLVRTCLAKDPDERWQSAHDVASELRWIAEGGSPGAAAVVVGPPRWPVEGLAWSITAAALLLAAAAVLFHLRRPAVKPQVVRSLIAPPAGGAFWGSPAVMALSPDGTRLAFVARDAQGKVSLWLRPLGSLSAQALAGTEDAETPFWSPDSRFLGLFARGKLVRISADGGSAETICDAPANRGATWGPDGSIVFAPRWGDVLYRVPSSGGTPTAVTRLDQGHTTHRWPWFLPDGRHFLFLARGPGEGEEKADLMVGSLESQAYKLVVRDASNAAYVSPGYVLFGRGGNLLAQRFDPERLQVAGEPTVLARDIFYARAVNFVGFSASQVGILTYTSPPARTSKLTWLDRSGKEIETVTDPGRYAFNHLSPDGKRVAVVRLDPASSVGDVWIHEMGRKGATRFTFQPMLYWMAWSPDGSRIALSGSLKGNFDLYERAAGGEGSETLLARFDSYFWAMPTDWSPDGRYLAFTRIDPKTAWDLWVLPLFGDRKPVLFLKTPFSETSGRFSPDGRLMAYMSNESGRSEVQVRPFPGPGGRWAVSTGGGGRPRWRRDGREIFYLAPDAKLMSVDIRGDSVNPEFGPPRPLFDLPKVVVDWAFAESASFDYDVGPDGQRFLVNLPVGANEPRPITLVLNWTAELER